MTYSKPVSKILSAVDDSNKSLEAADYAIKLAKDNDAFLIFANVLETEPWFFGKRPYEWGSKDELDKAYTKQRGEIQNILDGLRENAEKRGIKTKTIIIMSPRTTSTTAVIVKYAEDEKVDLIVVGTRGRSGITRMLLGSVASGIVTYAHCPVLVIK